MTEIEKAIEELLQKKVQVELLQELKSGKEAKVYVVQNLQTNELQALKVYHDFQLRSFQTQKHYFEDRYVGSDNAAIKRAIKKGNTVGKQFVQDTWVMREQYLLKKLAGQSEYVPKLIKPLKNGVLMEYIGDENGPAPRLSDVKIPDELIEPMLSILLDMIELFLVNGIIHGDFSPFNILWWKNRPIIIDSPQAVDVRESKRVYSLLKRDVRNIMKPYGYGDDVIEDVTVDMLERNALPLSDQ